MLSEALSMRTSFAGTMRLIEAPAKSFVSIARIAAIDGRRQATCHPKSLLSRKPTPLIHSVWCLRWLISTGAIHWPRVDDVESRRSEACSRGLIMMDEATAMQETAQRIPNRTLGGLLIGVAVGMLAAAVRSHACVRARPGLRPDRLLDKRFFTKTPGWELAGGG